MDDFGVLVKSYGIKPQGKSSPMASSKTTTTSTSNYNNKSVNLDPSSFGTNSTHNSNSGSGAFFYDQNEDIFGFTSTKKSQTFASSDVFDDVFNMPSNNSFSGGVGGSGGADFNIESMFKGSTNLNSKTSDVNDDLIWGFSGKTSSNVVVATDDLLSSDPVDDFFGKLEKLGSDQRGSKVVHTDDLLPGFGISNSKNDRAQAGSREKSSGSSSLEEFEDFVTGGPKTTATGRLNGFSATKEVKKTGSSLDELEDFVTGGMKKTDKGHLRGISAKKEAKNTFNTVSHKSQRANFIDLEGSLNGDSVHKNNVGKASDLLFPEEATDLDTFFGTHTKKSVPVTEDISMNRQTDGVPDLFSETPFKMEKKVPASGFPDDFSSIFGGASTSVVFEEIEGESEERRRARLGRYQRASARMAQALAEMNEREYQAQQEQEEKHRISDAMDVEMKRWAAGKEGNLRALLSSLQQVLAPELGWRPVTLTDLITSSQVKIAYKKAALCVHPDKVQQKGASLQQKFVAEKVFDLLKEAWNKFNAEELR